MDRRRGVADVLNNLGILYETQGDSATAEKMHRQALPIYRLLDDKRNQASRLSRTLPMNAWIRRFSEARSSSTKRVCSWTGKWPTLEGRLRD